MALLLKMAFFMMLGEFQFILCKKNNIDFHKLHPDLKRFKKDFPVIAWSSGKNKSNEFGYGDDIYVEKYVKQLVNNYP